MSNKLVLTQGHEENRERSHSDLVSHFLLVKLVSELRQILFDFVPFYDELWPLGAQLEEAEDRGKIGWVEQQIDDFCELNSWVVNPQDFQGEHPYQADNQDNTPDEAERKLPKLHIFWQLSSHATHWHDAKKLRYCQHHAHSFVEGSIVQKVLACSSLWEAKLDYEKRFLRETSHKRPLSGSLGLSRYFLTSTWISFNFVDNVLAIFMLCVWLPRENFPLRLRTVRIARFRWR